MSSYELILILFVNGKTHKNGCVTLCSIALVFGCGTLYNGKCNQEARASSTKQKEIIKHINRAGAVNPRQKGEITLFEFYSGSLEDLETLVRMHDTVQQAFYFWQSPKTQEARNKLESRCTFSKIEWRDGSSEYSAETRMCCYSVNITYKAFFYCDGVKCTVKKIRNSLKRMQEEDARQKYASIEQYIRGDRYDK